MCAGAPELAGGAAIWPFRVSALNLFSVNALPGPPPEPGPVLPSPAEGRMPYADWTRLSLARAWAALLWARDARFCREPASAPLSAALLALA